MHGFEWHWRYGVLVEVTGAVRRDDLSRSCYRAKWIAICSLGSCYYAVDFELGEPALGIVNKVNYVLRFLGRRLDHVYVLLDKGRVSQRFQLLASIMDFWTSRLDWWEIYKILM